MRFTPALICALIGLCVVGFVLGLGAFFTCLCFFYFGYKAHKEEIQLTIQEIQEKQQ